MWDVRYVLIRKIRVEGRDAEAFLNHICGANMSVPAGKIVYTQFLNERAGIEADVTSHACLKRRIWW